MGLDYSFILFFKRQDPWHILEGLAEFAVLSLENHTPIHYPDRIMRLPFEAWAGTEELLPISYDDQSKRWDFITVLYFEPDEELYHFALRNRRDISKSHERIPVGCIYLTVHSDWSSMGKCYDPNLFMLELTAATSDMSILFAQSHSMRAAFVNLLEKYQGVYGLIDREEDAVLFWLEGSQVEVEIPHAWMPLSEIKSLYKNSVNTDRHAFCASCGQDLTHVANSDGRMQEYWELVDYLCSGCVEELYNGSAFAIGDYLLMDEIGAGYEGVVFKAWHQPTGRQVAYKQSHLSLYADGEGKFSESILPLLSLNHPFFVRVLDFGVTEKKSFLVSEFMEGGDLWSRLANESPMPTATVLPWMLDILDALAYLHQKQMVHGNLHARNLLLSQRSGRQVMKLGIADWHLACSQPISDPEYDPPDPIIPYPYWMSPTQYVGYIKPYHDCYSLAAWVYYVLSGKPPLDFSTLAKTDLFKVMFTQTPIPLYQRASHVPEVIANVIDRALSNDPKVRYSDAIEFLHAMRLAASDCSS